MVAKVWLEGTRMCPGLSKTAVKRMAPLLLVAVPLWQAWQFGSCSHPVRVEAPTSDMEPWQLWHCMVAWPSVPTAEPMAPRKQRVEEPGWHW